MTDSFMDTITEPVFLATLPPELERAIELLDSHGITFTTERASLPAPRAAAGIREGIVFRVLNRQAEFCREVLTDHGLGRGVLAADVTVLSTECQLTTA